MVIAELYKLILETLTPEEGVTHIDLWNNQTANEEEELPFNRPAVFFEIENATFARMPNKRYVCDHTFNLHVVSDLMQETSSIEDKDIRNLGLEHLNLISRLMYLLDNLSDDDNGIGSIVYQGFKQFDNNYSDIIHHVIGFTVRLVDDSARHATRKVTPTYTAIVQKQA